MNLLQNSQYSWNIFFFRSSIRVLLELVHRATQNVTIIDEEKHKIDKFFTITTGLLVIMKPLIYVISMELLSLRRRLSPGETSLAVLEASSEESRLFSQAMGM